MKAEYDFSRGERGKFYRPDTTFAFPVYLEPDVDDFMSQLAQRGDLDVQALVNEWLRTSIRLIQTVEPASTSNKPS